MVRRRLVSRVGLGLLTALALLIGPAARAESDVHYFKERQFEIPYTSTPDPSFSRVILHVSTDQGKTYTEVGNSL